MREPRAPCPILGSVLSPKRRAGMPAAVLAAMLGAFLAGGPAGCLGHPSASDSAFDSPNPKARFNATMEANARETIDQATLRHLVEQLESADPLVRMSAITALKKHTGRTMDYRHYDPPAVRRQAIERWKEYVGGDTLEPSASRSSLDAAGETGRMN